MNTIIVNVSVFVYFYFEPPYQYFPSSKQCSCCGHKKDKLGLDERTYSCSNCGMNMDRDLNAAKNLEQLYTASSAGIYAFGDGSSLKSEKTLVSPSLN